MRVKGSTTGSGAMPGDDKAAGHGPVTEHSHHGRLAELLVPSMRLLAPLILAAAVVPLDASTVAAAQGAAGAADPKAGDPGCDLAFPTYDSREVSCPIRGSGRLRRFRFKALFSGGHDDTSASIQPALEDRPLVCDPGSKTSLFAEDGDIGLECSFSIALPVDAVRTFKVTVKWNHAIYTDFEFVAY